MWRCIGEVVDKGLADHFAIRSKRQSRDDTTPFLVGALAKLTDRLVYRMVSTNDFIHVTTIATVDFSWTADSKFVEESPRRLVTRGLGRDLRAEHVSYEIRVLSSSIESSSLNPAWALAGPAHKRAENRSPKFTAHSMEALEYVGLITLRSIPDLYHVPLHFPRLRPASPNLRPASPRPRPRHHHHHYHHRPRPCHYLCVCRSHRTPQTWKIEIIVVRDPRFAEVA